MKKEEILELSRKENKNKDLAYIEVDNKAYKLAAMAMFVLTAFYFVLEIALKDEINYGWYSLIALFSTVVNGIRAGYSKNKICIFSTIAWGILTIVFTCYYICSLL